MNAAPPAASGDNSAWIQHPRGIFSVWRKWEYLISKDSASSKICRVVHFHSGRREPSHVRDNMHSAYAGGSCAEFSIQLQVENLKTIRGSVAHGQDGALSHGSNETTKGVTSTVSESVAAGRVSDNDMAKQSSCCCSDKLLLCFCFCPQQDDLAKNTFWRGFVLNN